MGEARVSDIPGTFDTVPYYHQLNTIWLRETNVHWPDSG